jgi:hypothetical protein
MIVGMWWRILVALVLTLPPVAYVAGALAGDVEHRAPHPTVVLPTGGPEPVADPVDRRPGGDDRRRGVTVVRPDPVTVGENAGDDDRDDGDDGDDADDADD